MQQKNGQFFGETCRQQQTAGGLIFSENHYAPGQTTAPHSHEFPLFYLVVGGVCGEKTARRADADQHPAATLVFLPAGEVHSTHWSPEAGGGHCFHLEIHPAFCRRLPHPPDPLFSRTGPLSARRGTPPPRLLSRLYTEFLRWDTYSPLIAEGMVLELLGTVGRTTAGVTSDGDRGASWLAVVEARLRERLDQPPTLTELADLAGVHPSHLLRVFRQNYHVTPGEFVRQCRIDEACRRLRRLPPAGELPFSLGALARELGFADQSHFSRTFRALTGVTPGAYRRTLR